MAVRRGQGKAAGGAAPAGDRAGDPIDDLRRRIDAIDERLVRLLNERAGHAIRLGKIKSRRGLPIYQPAREEEVLANVKRANAGPLEDGALRRLFERIIDESRHIERVSTAAAGETGGPRPGAAGPGEPGDPGA